MKINNQVEQIEFGNTIKLISKILIFIGIVDIIYMIWAITQKMNYSSNIILIAIVGGIFLSKGNIHNARKVSIFIGIFIAVQLTSIISSYWLYPISYKIVLLKINTLSYITQSIINLSILLVFSWIYYKLTNNIIFKEMKIRGIKFDKPWKKRHIGLIIGLIIGVLTFLFSYTMFNGTTAKVVIEKAMQKNGTEYHYIIKGLNISTTNGEETVSANVVGYKNDEIKNIYIQY